MEGIKNIINDNSENLSIQHKKILKQHNKTFDLFSKMSKLKLCPADLFLKTGCLKNKDINIKTETILNCWKSWINE
jgi:hypothetical protein